MFRRINHEPCTSPSTLNEIWLHISKDVLGVLSFAYPLGHFERCGSFESVHQRLNSVLEHQRNERAVGFYEV
jgi:hypothetical protein